MASKNLRVVSSGSVQATRCWKSSVSCGPLAPLLIAISGKWTKTSEQLVGKAVGFDHYLIKPCDPQKLLVLLEPLRASSSGAARG